jgi:hypothetical protein
VSVLGEHDHACPGVAGPYAAHIDRLRPTGQNALVFEDANHSLRVDGDLMRTLAILRETVEAIGDFLRP